MATEKFIMKTEEILGYQVVSDSQEKVSEQITALISSEDSEQSNCCWFACMNPHSYAVAKKDSLFSEALSAADWCIPDGVGIVIGSKLTGGHIRERITGYDMFVEVNQLLDRTGGSAFFLGSSTPVLAKIATRMANDYPNIRITGMYSPPFVASLSQAENNKILAEINNSKPDVLWVAMSAPKQEKWIYENIDQIQARLAGPIGAVFDFYSGEIVRSSKTFQALGLEWLPRLVQEPKRLWRRMFISAPIFLGDLIKRLVSGR